MDCLKNSTIAQTAVFTLQFDSCEDLVRDKADFLVGGTLGTLANSARLSALGKLPYVTGVITKFNSRNHYHLAKYCTIL